ncbi:SNF1-related protein kinase regulatory subunit beta-2 [Macadamia integrifolia]|uniref:SNF1-related protein kinase regulatory subunit beta-2 n=1 Tax=Macadamia integrifolia TaxID=60698 RepID=UPI001C4E7400|nr:SNF1-related protein kinase regulatory subunit beta-2 [Macadamia integrifolia]
MGNVSVREVVGDPSGVGISEGDQYMESSSQVGLHDGYPAHGGSSKLMGPSPPHSPMATRSPLMFTPQVPVSPLQRPDEMQIPSYAWMQNTTEYDDMFCERRIPTMITWSYGGKEVAVEGSWDNWKTRKPLQRSGKEFTIVKVLPSGVYQYRFIVDGQWRYAPDMPWAHDDMGNAYNILDLQDYVPEDLHSIAGFEPPQSPDSSYDNNLPLVLEDCVKEPPLVPAHLQTMPLNVASSNMDSVPFSRPQHVVLNHLFMQKGNSGQSVVALGSTHRFLSKYVTVVVYKSLKRYPDTGH